MSIRTVPVRAVSARGHELVHVNRVGDPRLRAHQLLTADVVHVHRYADPEIRRVAQRLRQTGVGVVWDNDDDIEAVPRTHPRYQRLGGLHARRAGSAIAAMVRIADVVTTPSPLLAEKFRAAGATDVRVIENHVPPEFTRVHTVKHAGVVAVWLAGLEHQVDYQGLQLKSTLERLLERHADLEIISIGLGLGLQHARYEHIRSIEFTAIAQTLARGDIGLAPLVDLPWNRARSNVKLKEYAAAGLAWLASPVGPYRELGSREGGRLVHDEGWYDAIADLVRDARGRRKLAKQAKRWAGTQTIDAHAGRWEAAWADAHLSAKARIRRRPPDEP